MQNEKKLLKQKEKQLKQEKKQLKQEKLQAKKSLLMQQEQLTLQRKQSKIEAKHYKMEEKKYKKMAKCPKCGSTSLSGNKKGFGVGKGVIGAAVASHPIGLVAGNINARKVSVTCMNCGKRFKP